MDVMMNMTTDDVRVLREQFTDRMSLEQFVVTLKKTLHDRIHSELDFVVGVVELFHTIDVNGDEFLDWDEFAGYMMDAGQAKADFYFDDLLLRTKRYQHLPLLLRDDKTPLNNVRSSIQQMLHLHEQQALAYFERDSDVVYLYALHFDRNDAPRYLATMRLHTAFQEHTVICIEYVPPKKLLVVSSMLHVGYVSTWSIADLHSPVMVHRVESHAPHEHLCWVPALQCLLSSAVVFPAIAKKPSASSSGSNIGGGSGKGRVDGYRPHAATQITKLNQLLRWDLSSGASRNGGALVATELALKDRLKSVSSLATFKCINRTHIAIGCEDGVITVIDAESWVTVSSFDAHGNGVKMLRFSPQTECLASIGYHSYSDETTLHVAIWRKRGAAGRLEFEASLKHHDAPLELIAFVDSRRQLLSLDTSGVFNVYSSVLLTPTSDPWEVLQRFHVAPAPAPSRIQSCFVVPESAASDAVLVTAGCGVAFYDHCDVKEREEVFYCHYCETLNLLVGVTLSKLLFWNADSGKLWKTFAYAAILAAATSPLDTVCASAPVTKSSISSGGGSGGRACSRSETPRTITAACMDDRERKVILGDDAGSLKVINAVNGNVMKELDPHAHAIASVAYALRGKRVLSISIDSSLHIYDENNALGYYVPFGAPHPQSVLLHSLRFLPEMVPAFAAPTALEQLLRQRELELQQQRYRRRTRRCSTEVYDDISAVGSTTATSSQPERFEIVKSVGNLELDKVAVLVSGSRGESFIQVWDFDMSHTQGTCIAPLDDEITCMGFVGSSADIIGGTASGRVFLWRAMRDDPGYHCSLELQCSSEDPNVSSSEPRVATIHHVITANAAHARLGPTPTARTEQRDERSESTTVSDGDRDASSTFQLTNVPLQLQPQQQHDALPQHQYVQDEEGMYVFAGDDLGVVTVWFVRHSGSSTHPSALHHALTVGTDVILSAAGGSGHATAGSTTAATPLASSNGAGAMLQHEEMVLGYDAVAALYKRAYDQERHARATATALGESGDIITSRRLKKLPSQLPQLAPTRRWEAHEGPILCLSHALDPRVVLTSSARGRIKIWSFDGAALGVLDDFASRRQPVEQLWRFPLDMDERRRRKERDAQQFLEKSKGLFRRGKQPRMSVMQERLSLSHDELTFDYSAEKRTARRQSRHSRFVIRTSDVGRAIRKFVLAQAAPTSASAPSPVRMGAGPSSHDAQDSSRSLQVVLKEIDQLQLQTSARSGSAGLSARRDTSSIGNNGSAHAAASAQRAKKHYARVMLADVKPLLSLRPRSSNAVHCELSQHGASTSASATSRDNRASSHIPSLHLPVARQPSSGLLRRIKRPKEIVFTTTSLRKGPAASYTLQVASPQDAHLTLHDLRDEAHTHAQQQKQSVAMPSVSSLSNQDVAAGMSSDLASKPQRRGSAASSSKNNSDPVLKYHVKLAHSWQQYQVR